MIYKYNTMNQIQTKFPISSAKFNRCHFHDQIKYIFSLQILI